MNICPECGHAYPWSKLLLITDKFLRGFECSCGHVWMTRIEEKEDMSETEKPEAPTPVDGAEAYTIWMKANDAKAQAKQEVIPNADPWKHRSTGMKCATCMWFVEKAVEHFPLGANGGPTNPNPNPKNEQFGRCRRHAPTMQGYPVVFGHDWCGDHKLDENKR